jgi:hypothetical protein
VGYFAAITNVSRETKMIFVDIVFGMEKMAEISTTINLHFINKM